MRNPPKPIKACRTVADLLADHRRWGKKTPWKPLASLRAATVFDVMDAIELIYPAYGQTEARRKLRLAAGIKGTLTSWNDAPERTHAEVLEAVRRAGI